jgi:hypothetical protein
MGLFEDYARSYEGDGAMKISDEALLAPGLEGSA